MSTSTATLEAQISQQLDAYIAAFNAGDFATASSHYNEPAISISASAVTMFPARKDLLGSRERTPKSTVIPLSEVYPSYQSELVLKFCKVGWTEEGDRAGRRVGVGQLRVQEVEEGWVELRGVHGDLYAEEDGEGLVDCGHSSTSH